MKKTSFRNRIIWIVLTFFLWYILFAELAVWGFEVLLLKIPNLSNSMTFVLQYYTCILASIIVFCLMCLILKKKNRMLLNVIGPQKDTLKWFGIGVGLGFATNFFCILCALIHKDISFYLDFSIKSIPFLLFAFISVLFQSASEEIWCRGFLYERINVHYPLWVAIVVNAVLFGLLHGLNPGITVLAMFSLILCGLSYSALRWYTGSIWASFGIHTMWNFTQNLLFGLPNSGLVSETSVWHLDSAIGNTNLIYDYTFGVEGAIPAILMDGAILVIILILAKKNNRLGELKMSKEKLELLNNPAE